MQAAAPPQPLAALAFSSAADFQQAQCDALRTIHTMMLRLADTLTKPRGEDNDDDKEDAEEARTTTQRIRLCLQAARDLLRFRPAVSPTDPDNAPALPQPPTTRPRRKPGLTAEPPDASPHAETSTATANAQVSSLLAAAGRAFGSEPRTKAGSEVATQSVSDQHHFDERLAPSHALEVQTVQARARASSTPSAPFTVTPSAAALLSYTVPPQPPQIADEDRRQIIDAVRSGRTLSVELYDKFQNWNAYAKATGLPPPFGITAAQIEACRPRTHQLLSGVHNGVRLESRG